MRFAQAMEIRTYRAATMHEALGMVRRDLGPDAAVLHTREVPAGRLWGRLMGSREIEVTASVGVNVPVTCAGVAVRPKDIITADEDGVVVVPLEKAAEVLKKAQDLDNTEHSMYPFIERFKSLTEAIARFGRL